MAQFSLWPATRNHPTWQNLTLPARALLIDMCVLVADGERTEYPGGFFLAEWIGFCAYLKINTKKAIAELEENKILQRIDDPEGWLINGWTDRARVLRPTSAEGKAMPLGQKPAAHYAKQRSKAMQAGQDPVAAPPKPDKPWVDTSYEEVDPLDELFT
ncbi:MAG: hypothetical protein EBU85_07620 [Actinobacteria bacterium]|nr:hypothetical protein [Actinomycetota bacterium]